MTDSNLPESLPSATRSLYQQFLAEREEVLKHKWLCSEEKGQDIGFDTALIDWATHHREDWKSQAPKKKSG